MIKDNIKILVPPQFKDKMENLMTISSPKQDLGITIAGENMYPTSKNPILRIFLIEKLVVGWAFKKELRAFTFKDYNSAQSYFKNLPTMSALDLLIDMNSGEASSESVSKFLS